MLNIFIDNFLYYLDYLVNKLRRLWQVSRQFGRYNGYNFIYFQYFIEINIIFFYAILNEKKYIRCLSGNEIYFIKLLHKRHYFLFNKLIHLIR